ncbi:MAG TPA: ankyrin repeat domain-containing protein [Tepidisphaeraceae bacterium]|jgi:ankyrin repeat protein
MLLACACPSLGHEVDQFTYPPDRQFADMGGYLTRYFYDAIERGVTKTNEQIRAAVQSNNRKAVAELQSGDTIARAVNREFPVALFLIESFDDTLTKPEARQHYPGRICNYKLNSGDVRKYVDLPLSPFNAWKSGTMMAFGMYVGTDKIGHFTDMGMHYFDAYREARRKGASEEDAMKTAIKRGTDDPIYSEKGLLGWATAGAYSNADLVANYTGCLFYRNLFEPVMLKGQVRSPMVEREGDYWKISPRVTRDSDFYSLFISEHLNEALNPSLYLDNMKKPIGKAIRERSTQVLEHYKDRFGNRHSPQWFVAKFQELSTYYGQYYGHLGDERTLMLVSNMCFGTPPDRIDGRDAVGRTPLHIAAEAGDIKTMQALVERGADVNVQVKSDEYENADWGNTPLHLAARNGKTDAVQYLVFRGASINAVNHRGVTPLHMASHWPEVAALLTGAGATVDAPDCYGRTPLHWAAADPEDKEARALATLLRAGGQMDRRDKEGRTALAHAALNTNAEAAFMLLKCGASVQLADRLGATPLHLAARTGDPQLVDLLIRAHAPLNNTDDFGCTPLHDATRVGSTYAVALLLRSGADPRLHDAYGGTALHLASRYAHDVIATMLLQHGADVYARTTKGLMAIDEAQRAGAASMVNLLRDAATRNPTPAPSAVSAAARMGEGGSQ